MSQSRRTIEQLLQQDILPLKNAEAAATYLEVYPSKRMWLEFFDKALLIIGAVALVLSLMFFIAYNWQHMGKMGKFALVEVALVITIALYVTLSFRPLRQNRQFRQRFQLIRQLLLLIASIITGSLLALFGQVYQTGADTWQLFFAWALLITPWVVIARFPALWLLWLGLVNAFLLLYLNVANLQFINHNVQNVFQVAILALFNLGAFYSWLIGLDNKTPFSTPHLFHRVIPKKSPAQINSAQTKSNLHWSTDVVGLLTTFFITYLAIVTVFDNGDIWTTSIAIVLWLGWCGFMLWQFYQRRVDLLMLTYLSFSVITVVMFWVSKWLLHDLKTAGFLILALLLIAMSSAAVMWLSKITRVKSDDIASSIIKGSSDEQCINHNEKQPEILLLQQQGLIDTQNVSDKLLNNAASAARSPWFISLLFGMSGILASLFFIGFLTLLLDSTGLLDSTLAVFIIGALLSIIGGCLLYNARIRHSPFWSSLAFAITLAGQGYIAYALLASEMAEPLNILLLLLVQLFMTVVMPNFIYRLLSATLALVCLFYLLIYYHLSEVSLGLLALITSVAHLQRYTLAAFISHKWRARFFDISRAIGYASAYILLLVSVYFIAAEYGNSFDNLNSYGEAFSYNYYLAQGLLTLASLYAAYLILKRYHIKLLPTAGLLISAAIIILGVASIYVSGLLATSLIIIIATANSQRVLLGLGIIALVGYIFWYYYQLDTSLLLKSASMLVIAIALLLLRWRLIKSYFAHIKPSASDNQERLS
ncbi:DUF4401 domain-containing protein [Psychrobacter sp. UBA5136]|uniref:DUF4401 domain-containing protein n=1 Tax=Psychrobacter sp. UBA5136 TaxID=1947356 RepID=UPI0025F75DCB|nr:DUF4401 domain-containing protein [Psychrobacter sp. UBA5136]